MSVRIGFFLIVGLLVLSSCSVKWGANVVACQHALLDAFNLLCCKSEYGYKGAKENQNYI